MRVQIRPWTAEDIPVLTKMERECFVDPWTEEMLKDCLRYPYYHCFLAEEGGQVCGYCCLIHLFEDGEIANIAVESSFRGRGIAKLLMESMHERAKTLGGVRTLLEVRKSNTPAVRLYESFGYKQYGVRARYYEDGEDALLMERKL